MKTVLTALVSILAVYGVVACTLTLGFAYLMGRELYEGRIG